jgi:hypothetical protein
MHSIPSSPDSWYNLPRSSGVAYAAQESWVLNETIRSNITFDTPFDEERYKKVLYQCALEPDLALFQAGDQTEVGEKGLGFFSPRIYFFLSTFKVLHSREVKRHASRSPGLLYDIFQLKFEFF